MASRDFGNPFMERISDVRASQGEGTATIQGTAWKGLLLLIILVAIGGWAFLQTFPFVEIVTGVNKDGKTIRDISNFGPLGGYLWMAALGGLGIGIVTIWKPTVSPFTAPLYTAAQGLLLGVISAGYEKVYPGIVLMAALGSLGVMALMLLLYAFRIIRYTPGFGLGLTIALGGVLIAYLCDMGIRMFGGPGVPGLNDSSPLGILISVLICGFAALCFVGDFASIEYAEEVNAPRYMEWYGAFSMMVTLIWLYLEILKLLAKTRSNK